MNRRAWLEAPAQIYNRPPVNKPPFNIDAVNIPPMNIQYCQASRSKKGCIACPLSLHDGLIISTFLSCSSLSLLQKAWAQSDTSVNKLLFNPFVYQDQVRRMWRSAIERPMR